MAGKGGLPACLPAGWLPLAVMIQARLAVMRLASLNLSLFCLNALIVDRVHSEGVRSKCVATFERHRKEQEQGQGQEQEQEQEQEQGQEESAMPVAAILSQPVACHAAKGNYPHCRFIDVKDLLDVLFSVSLIRGGFIELSDLGRSLQGEGFFIIRPFCFTKYYIVKL